MADIVIGIQETGTGTLEITSGTIEVACYPEETANYISELASCIPLHHCYAAPFTCTPGNTGSGRPQG